MKLTDNIFLAVLLAAAALADPPTLEKLSKPPPGYTYRLLGDGVVELTDDFGAVWRKDLNEIDPNKSTKQAKKIIEINLNDIDTTGFGDKMKYVTTVPLGVESTPPLVGDTDGDGLVELAGNYISEELNSASTRIYEKIAANSDSFHLVYTYPIVMNATLAGDLNNNGQTEYWFWEHKSNRYFIYESPEADSLATLNILTYFRGGAGPTHPRIDDFDQDGRNDFVHSGADSNGKTIEIVAEYNKQNEEIQRVWTNRRPYYQMASHWSIGDLDNDGKKEFGGSNYYRTVLWFEHNGSDNGYDLVFTDTLLFPNNWYNTEGDDMDGDGRKELFIGGAGFYYDIWTNSIICYETIGDNNFERSVELRIRGMGGWNEEFIMQADVDGDGLKELVFSAGFTVAIIKSTGDDDYAVWWYKHFARDIGVSAADTDDDGKDEILVSYAIPVPASIQTVTEIYAYSDTTTNVKQKMIIGIRPSDFILHHNYPNPFNAHTTIQYELKRSTIVELSIFNIHGKEVKSYVKHKKQPAGVYRITWDGTDKSGRELSAGIYFARLRAGDQTGTIKMLLVR